MNYVNLIGILAVPANAVNMMPAISFIVIDYCFRYVIYRPLVIRKVLQNLVDFVIKFITVTMMIKETLITVLSVKNPNSCSCTHNLLN